MAHPGALPGVNSGDLLQGEVRVAVEFGPVPLWRVWPAHTCYLDPIPLGLVTILLAGPLTAPKRPRSVSPCKTHRAEAVLLR